MLGSIRQKNQGFTIFDMLLAIGLIAVFSALVAANYSDFRQAANLRGESEKMSSLIRKAQLWALSGQTRGGVRPPGGWGVYVEQCITPPCRFFLYADMSPTFPPNHSYDAGIDEIVNEVFTGQSVQISNVAPSTGNAVDLVFTSPTSTGYINGTKINNQAIITFYHEDAYRFQNVTIDRITNRVVLADITDPPVNPACSDGLDNDGDTYIDLDDPGCINSTDNDEFHSVALPPPTAITVFEDTFTQSDLELTTYTPDLGTGWQQIISVVINNEAPGASLMASLNNNQLEDDGSGGAGFGVLYQTLDVMSESDYQVQATYSNSASQYDYAVIAARIQDTGDMYLYQWDQNRGQLLVRYNNAWLQLGRNTVGANIGDQLRLRVHGDRIAVWNFNGAISTLLINEVNNIIPSAFPPGRAGVGLGSVATYDSNNQSVRLDDFQVLENIQRPPPQCDDGLDNDNDGWTDILDGDCGGNINHNLEYPNPPQIVPAFFDDFNATANTVLDSPNYPTYVGPLFGTGWSRIISINNGVPSSDMTLRANAAFDRLDDGGVCAGNDGVLYRTLDPMASPDYEVSVDYRNADTNDDYSVLAARIQDQNNMYAFHWSATQGQLWLRNAGTWTQLGSNVAGIVERDIITLKVMGSNISVLRNGNQILSVFDPTITSPGYAGVGMGRVVLAEDGLTGDPDCSGQLLDNFKVIIP